MNNLVLYAVCCASAMLALSCRSSAAEPVTDDATERFEGLVIFGDSLSDNGSSDEHGFRRATNGDVWGDFLARKWKCSTYENRAWSGARSDRGNANNLDWSGFHWQLDHYSPPRISSRTLHAVWVGLNDIYDGHGDPEEVVRNIRTGLDRLAGKGAKQVMVFNLIDITQAPAYRQSYVKVKDIVQRKLVSINTALQTELLGPGGFQQKYPGVQLHLVDTHSWFDSLLKNQVFEDTLTTLEGTYLRPHPVKYLWWDDWHPTTSFHRRVADMVDTVMAQGERRSSIRFSSRRPSNPQR